MDGRKRKALHFFLPIRNQCRSLFHPNLLTGDWDSLSGGTEHAISRLSQGAKKAPRTLGVSGEVCKRETGPPLAVEACCAAETGRRGCVQTPELWPGQSSLTVGQVIDAGSGAGCFYGNSGGGKLRLEQCKMQEGAGAAESSLFTHCLVGQGGMSFPWTSGPHEGELGSIHDESTSTSGAVRGSGVNLQGPTLRSMWLTSGNTQYRKPAFPCWPHRGHQWPCYTSEIDLGHFSPNSLFLPQL